MSAQAATARPLSTPAARPVRRLRALELPALRRRPRLWYGLIAVAAALGIVGAQMVLSVMTTQSSYELARLNSQHHELTLQKQVLDDELAGLGSPQYLAANAAALGMVVDKTPSYLRLSDGKILGAQKAASSTSAITLGKGSVANELIADTPLVTDPHATIDGNDKQKKTSTTENMTPVPVTDGLPTVRTH
ncbi:hypothetical protein PU630_06275 [Microbacterium horticulturae]|uniref:Cell division protein FtsL n=1 Tax=Microbacterium horticulturae TaxID=3028316 RepID=A0ABY8C516_9MICO|nr:hypothetical protein [Microbacterium sp. KACC 23027]WEG10156.1 hypothetical protein PU630_06275 [Microbacterium sp. KACC 23027]